MLIRPAHEAHFFPCNISATFNLVKNVLLLTILRFKKIHRRKLRVFLVNFSIILHITNGNKNQSTLITGFINNEI